MDRTERFYKIDQLLNDHRVVPVATFLDQLGISLATFKRDLDYLRDRLHAPIVWDREARGTRVEIVLVSRNSGDSGLRVMHSIREHGLDIVRAVFTNGEPPYRYIPALGTQLFLSANPADVRAALDAGHAAATILPSQHSPNGSGQLRLAFDGDAVLFSDEAERVYQQHGLAAWQQHEHLHADKPLPGGPFKPFLDLLAHIQRQFPADANPIRTALVTARGAPAHERVIKTLRSWNVRIDEALFLGGRPKGPFLAAFGADLFFDDQMHNCATACEHVPTGHVPSGVVNE